MDKWSTLVEERLQAAFDTGAFANLPGKGKPLNFDDDPLADPAHWLARHILRNSGMSLPWVEERRRIEETLCQARNRLAQSWSAHSTHRISGLARPAIEARWQEALAAYGEEISALNRRIQDYNLIVPHVRFQRCLIKAEGELSRLRQEGANPR